MWLRRGEAPGRVGSGLGLGLGGHYDKSSFGNARYRSRAVMEVASNVEAIKTNGEFSVFDISRGVGPARSTMARSG